MRVLFDSSSIRINTLPFLFVLLLVLALSGGGDTSALAQTSITPVLITATKTLLSKTTITTFTSGTIVTTNSITVLTTLLPTSTYSFIVSKIIQRILTALPQTTLTITTSDIDIVPFEVLPPIYKQHHFLYTPSYAGTKLLTTTVVITQPPIYIRDTENEFMAAATGCPICPPCPKGEGLKGDGGFQVQGQQQMNYILNKDGIYEMVSGFCTTILACRPQNSPDFPASLGVDSKSSESVIAQSAGSVTIQSIGLAILLVTQVIVLS